MTARDIAYLPQAAEIDRSFPINVYDMVAMGLWRRKGLFGGIDRKDHAAIEAGLAAVGLTGFEQRSIGTLSGGQMQRMLFARLLVQDARVIVLDEPFSAIDSKTVADLMHLVRQWHWERRTVLAATHDIELVRAYFPQVLLLAREPVAWGATREVLTRRESRSSAPHVRGVRRDRRSLRQRGRVMPNYPPPRSGGGGPREAWWRGLACSERAADPYPARFACRTSPARGGGKRKIRCSTTP